MSVILIPPATGVLAVHLLLSDLFERQFDEVKLVRRMWFAAAAALLFMLVVIVCEM